MRLDEDEDPGRGQELRGMFGRVGDEEERDHAPLTTPSVLSFAICSAE
jgi:hypothetical protein